MMNFTSMFGIIPREARTLQEVANTGVFVKNEPMTTLSTSDQLKLPKATRGGGSEKLLFFETTSSIGSDFQKVNDLHMQVKDLFEALMFYALIDVFQVLDEAT